MDKMLHLFILKAFVNEKCNMILMIGFVVFMVENIAGKGKVAVTVIFFFTQILPKFAFSGSECRE